MVSTFAADETLQLQYFSEAAPPQIHPLMDGQACPNDIWEHSYYLKYQNPRGDHLKAWWDVVNWTKISDHYAEAKKGTLTI